MEYALVKEGKVQQVGLPVAGILKDGRSVSVYNQLDDATLKSEGWLPIQENISAYDITTQMLQDQGYTVEVDKVMHNYAVVAKPPQSPTLDERITAAENAVATLMGV
jgi:hypothetical protein